MLAGMDQNPTSLLIPFFKTYLPFYSAKRDNQPTRHPASEEPEVQERKDSTEGRAKGDVEG